MRESKYLNEIVSSLHEASVLKINGNSNMPKGTPDLFVCLLGHLVVIEVKVGNNQPTDIQKYMLDYWARSGAIAFWTSDLFANPKQVSEFVNEAVVYQLTNLKPRSSSFWQKEFRGWLEST